MWPNPAQTWLLKACLFSDRSGLDAWKNWTQQIDFDRIDPASYNLLPLAFRNLSLAPPQDPVFTKCKGIYRQTWVLNQLHWEKMIPIFTRLLQEGLEKIVLLKGIAMILHYYRDFGVRVMGDIDILIPKERLPLVAPFFFLSGWKPTVSRFDLNSQEHLNRWHALNFKHPEGMDLDLHWSFIQENSSYLDRAVLFDAKPISVKNLELYIPNPTDLLLQICAHGVKYSPIPLIRWIPDAVTVLRQSKIDWERFIDLASKAHISLSTALALEYLQELFNSPIPAAVIQKLKAIPVTALESSEYQSNRQGYQDVAAWHRYCLNRGYLTTRAQILHLHQYLQCTARLKSAWQIPFFSIYWIFNRLCRASLRFFNILLCRK